MPAPGKKGTALDTYENNEVEHEPVCETGGEKTLRKEGRLKSGSVAALGVETYILGKVSLLGYVHVREGAVTLDGVR